MNKQRHNYTCGHVAIINLLKYLKISCNYKKGIKLVESVKYKTKNKGTWPYQLAACLDKLKINYNIHLNNNTNKIKKLLLNGRVVLWLFSWKHKDKRHAHWVFIEKFKNNKFKIFNFKRKANKTNFYKTKTLGEFIHHTRTWLPEAYDFCFSIGETK